MADEADGVDEAVQVAFQAAMITASRMGEQLARMQEQSAREAKSRSGQAARDYGQRLDAERAAARASVAAVQQGRWWEQAQPADIARVYQTTATWADRDEEVSRAQDRIVTEVAERYGVSLDPAGDRESVAEALSTVDAARHDTQRERGQSARDELDAAQLLHEANNADARSGHDPSGGEQQAGNGGVQLRDESDFAYDSSERRETMAKDLDHLGNDAAVEARVRADASQARPASEATHGAGRGAPTARRSQGRGGRQQEKVTRSR